MENTSFNKFQNPAEYLKVFFRRKWLIIIPVLCGLLLGIVACFLFPRSYESYTVILVKEEKVLNPLIQGLAVSTNIGQRMQTIREQLLGWYSLVQLTKKLNLDKEVSSQYEFEQLILNLRNAIQVKMLGPMFIRISYESKDPQETQLVVQTLSDILIEENMRTQTEEADVAINFIKEQLQVYKRKIKESEIAGLQDKLDRLLLDSTEMHPMVKELREKITIAQSELNSGEYEVSVGEQPVLDPKREVIKQELDKLIDQEVDKAKSGTPGVIEPVTDTNSTLYKLMLMDKVDTTLARDITVNETIYNMLLQKLETAKITQRLEASKQGTTYIVIDPPRLPLKPAKPDKVKVLFMGLFLGGFIGVGLVFAREFLDHSFIDIEDAKVNLKLPILGAISRITTIEEVSKERGKNRLAVISGSAISIVLIITAMVVSFLKK